MTKMVIGFTNEHGLVQAFVKVLKTKAAWAKVESFRAGEMRVTGPVKAPREVTVVSNVTEDPSTLFRLSLLAQALRAAGCKHIKLIAPWIAYGRQDRATKKGESPAGLVVSRLLSQTFDKIVTLDAHSPAFIKSFKGKLKNVLPIKALLPSALNDLTLIAAPDQGAAERARDFAKHLRVPCVVMEKVRTGEKVKARILGKTSAVAGARVLLVDDMADSGKTLAAAANTLYKNGAADVQALVTHSFDLKHLNKRLVLDCVRVWSVYDHANLDHLPAEAVNLLAA